jgi:two-component system nitrogen regulation response regulator GlnG
MMPLQEKTRQSLLPHAWHPCCRPRDPVWTISQLTSFDPWWIISPSSSAGTFMTIRSSVFSILLLTVDPDLQAQIEEDLKRSAHAVPFTVTVAKDSASASHAAVRRTFDGIMVETKRGQPHDLTEVQRAIDPARTFIVAGPRSTLRQASGMLLTLAAVNGRPAKGGGSNFFLQDYIESKLGNFVKEMKNGSARNLHPMLIKAVEQPLIAFALKETNGNQIQAAHLLGMNRNTLRKKITELRIPIKREKARSA